MQVDSDGIMVSCLIDCHYLEPSSAQKRKGNDSELEESHMSVRKRLDVSGMGGEIIEGLDAIFT